MLLTHLMRVRYRIAVKFTFPLFDARSVVELLNDSDKLYLQIKLNAALNREYMCTYT